MAAEQKTGPAGPVTVSVGGEGARPPLPERKDNRERKFPELLPIIPVKELSLFPRMVLPMLVEQGRHQTLIDEVVAGEKLLGLLAHQPGREEAEVASLDDLHRIGVVAVVLQMARTEQGGISLITQGLARFEVLELLSTQPFLLARVRPAEEVVEDDLESRALLSNLRALFARMLTLSPHLPDELKGVANGVREPGPLCDLIASAMNLKPGELQAVVAALSVKTRLKLVTDLVNREIQVLELGSQIQSQVKEGLDKSQREYYLRQQLKAIQKELGEEDGEGGEAAEYRRRLAEKALPDLVRAEAEREIGRLARMHPSSGDYHVITTYLDWILALPWREAGPSEVDLKKARQVLEEDHYDLEKVKRRILEYLAVLKLNPAMKGPILCFVGPPGVGKTSLGRSVAKALGREVRPHLLAACATRRRLRGHRAPTWAALPGRIIRTSRGAARTTRWWSWTRSTSWGPTSGADPASALLEVLDPEQKRQLLRPLPGPAFDLSKVIFLTTANQLDTVRRPCATAWRCWSSPATTAQDKLKIAKRASCCPDSSRNTA